MFRDKRGWFVVFFVALVYARTAWAAEPLSVWVVDPHTKVFRDARPPAAAEKIQMRAARNEYESAQIALLAGGSLKGVRVELSALRQEGGQTQIGPEHLTWNFVGFIPLVENTPKSEKRRVCTAPCEVPDPLLDRRSMDLEAGKTQPVWISAYVPADAAAGVYRGEAAVVAGDKRVTVPLELTVDPFALPKERHLFVTNWFRAENIAEAHKLELWSEPFWAMLRRYAENMAAHRQNVVLTPWSLVKVTRGADGKLSLDTSRFDRFVEVFEQAGMADRIELGHVAHFGPRGWGGNEIQLTTLGAIDQATGKEVKLGPEQGILPFLTALEKHLESRGWLAKAMIHVADEPSVNNVASWREVSAAVHKAAPRLRRIDAIETIDFTGALEVWVPKLSHFERWREAYEARRDGNEFWYYICCHPYGSVYPNRFLDSPLTDVRLLHWINFADDLSGYLHWGGNFWGDDPFGVPRKGLPPGDTHVIYPGSDGPLNSMRWEIARESLEDYEYLHLLASKSRQLKEQFGPAAAVIDPQRRARELCRALVPTITDVERDATRIEAVRNQVADEIVAMDQKPLALIQTEPAEGTTLVVGPIQVEVYGVAEPGATITVDGRAVAQHADGSFACGRSWPEDKTDMTIEVERDGQKKTIVRKFAVRQ